MKTYIKDFNSFLNESSIFIPRNIDSRFDKIKKQYIDKGYKSEEIYVGDITIKSKEELLNNKYKIIIGNFGCAYIGLTNLKGCPEIIIGWFDCSYNKLTSLEGCPKEVNGNFWCSNNNNKFTEEEVNSICKVKGEIYI